MAEIPKSDLAAQNSLGQNKPKAATARLETARDIYMRLAAKNPRFKEVKNSGKGFVIVGAKP